MPLKTSKYIWHDGELIPWEEATVHVLTHALHYGSSVFEGIRVYKSPDGPVGFRLTDHIRRMFNSAKVYYLGIPYSLDTLVAACKEVVMENGLFDGAYIRPLAYRGYGEMGVAGDPDAPANCSIAAWRMTNTVKKNSVFVFVGGVAFAPSSSLRALILAQARYLHAL